MPAAPSLAVLWKPRCHSRPHSVCSAQVPSHSRVRAFSPQAQSLQRPGPFTGAAARCSPHMPSQSLQPGRMTRRRDDDGDEERRRVATTTRRRRRLDDDAAKTRRRRGDEVAMTRRRRGASARGRRSASARTARSPGALAAAPQPCCSSRALAVAAPQAHSRCKPPQPLAVAAAPKPPWFSQSQSLPSVAAAALLPLLTSDLDNGGGQRARRDDDAARVGGDQVHLRCILGAC